MSCGFGLHLCFVYLYCMPAPSPNTVPWLFFLYSPYFIQTSILTFLNTHSSTHPFHPQTSASTPCSSCSSAYFTPSFLLCLPSSVSLPGDKLILHCCFPVHLHHCLAFFPHSLLSSINLAACVSGQRLCSLLAQFSLGLNVNAKCPSMVTAVLSWCASLCLCLIGCACALDSLGFTLLV